MLKKLGCLFLILVTGCKTLVIPVKQKDLNSVDKLGILSLVDDKIQFSYVGITIFNNEDDLFQADGFGIDKAISNQLNKEIKKYSQIQSNIINAKSKWISEINGVRVID